MAQGNTRERIFGAPNRQPSELDAPRTAEEAAERIADTLNSNVPQEAPPQQQDPARPASHLAAERAEQLVTNISSHTNDEIRKLREQLDDLMRDVNARRDALVDAIRRHAEYAETAIQSKEIIGESIRKLREAFDSSCTALPPSGTVTQQRRQ